MNDIYFYLRKDAYGWLSNFWRAEQVVGGFIYPTNEHFYQAMKARDLEMVEWIAKAPTPYAAMMAGRSLRDHEMVENWERGIKLLIMKEGLLAKFSQNPELKKKLIDTGDTRIHEDSPTDEFWGVKGRDMLGKLLMKIREELRDEL